jgi:rhodanese-related sulfurtransferase
MNVCVRKWRRASRLPVVLAMLSLAVAGTCFAGESQSAPLPAKSSAIKNVGVEEFDRLRTGKNTITLDVRTAEEYTRGHVPGAVNVDWNAKDFAEKVAALDKSQTYLVHCAAGVRSAKACARMTKLNFKKLYNLEGGFKAWEEAGKPVEKTKLSER